MGALKQPSLSRRLSMAQCISLGVVCAAEAPMRLVSALNRPALRLASQPPPTLSRQAKQRLKWFDWHASHGRNVSLTCRYFGISRQTFYRWQRRYNPQRIQTLEDRLSRPHQRRQPTWTLPQRQAVHALREQYPRWGKDKLKVLLDRQRLVLSVSMVGRILSHLKRSAPVGEPVGGDGARKRSWQRPYAVRKPRDYAVAAPGDLVQIDTLDVRPSPGVVLKHFTARDVVSRWDVLELASRATARTATRALEAVLERMPFPVSAIQVDGGSEFMADFEAACAALGTWEVVYNTVRPHQALGYLTPLEFVTAWNQHHAREEECNGGTERVQVVDSGVALMLQTHGSGQARGADAAVSCNGRRAGRGRRRQLRARSVDQYSARRAVSAG